MELVNAAEFFHTARERHQIYLNRQLHPKAPELWTKDEIFQTWRFCQVFRELDKTTIWFRQNIREPLSEIGTWDEIVQATVIFRWFNRIETGEKIKHLLLGEWNTEQAREILKDISPVVSGAFIIKGPDGFNKLNGVLYCIDQALQRLPDVVQQWEENPHSLREAWLDLVEFYYLGPFMAYEIVTDLRWTPVLEHAPDIMTWCNIGPGAARGLSHVVGKELKFFNSNSVKDQEEMLELCRQLLVLSQNSELWPSDWPKWEMREIEHWNCELAKYVQGRGGKRLKRRFQL